MNTKETAAVMDILSAAYPQFYRGMGPAEKKAAVDLWAGMFKDDPLQIVLVAVKRLIATDTKGFPPPIGAVKEQIWRIQNPRQLTEQEAWQMVARAVNTADAEKAFAALPPEVRQIVGSPVQLTQWGRMDETAFQSVVASHIQRSFRAKMENEKEQAKLPPDVRQMELDAVQRMLLPGIAPGPGLQAG